MQSSQQGSMIATAIDHNAAADCGWLNKSKTEWVLIDAMRTGTANRMRQTYLLALKDQSDHRQASPSPQQVRRMGLASCDAIIRQGSMIETATSRNAATGCGWQAMTKLGIDEQVLGSNYWPPASTAKTGQGSRILTSPSPRQVRRMGLSQQRRLRPSRTA